MTRTIATTVPLLALLSAPAFAIRANEATSHQPVVQLAILLDTSGSMSGLIEQAKTQLWASVN